MIGGQRNNRLISLFLSGDVMTGRGIDQILGHPGAPALHEEYVKDARVYVKLAEEASSPIPRRVNDTYIWGDGLYELEREAPDVRIINLETSLTTSNDYWEGKEVHYRMNPENIGCITAAAIDVCSLANNHVLDWGYEGLKETLERLKNANIKSAGAGINLREAGAPAIVEIEGKGRVIVFAYGSPTSGVRLSWASTETMPGVNILSDFSDDTVRCIRESIRAIKQKNDVVVFSIHWGGNWGYDIPGDEIRFAHGLIEAGVDIIHGHSSHHVKGIEVYHDRLVLYGCGDFLNDYEGIAGYEHFRNDLALMYFASMDPETGQLVQLRMVPTRTKYFRVNRASKEEALWLAQTLQREGRKFGTEIELDENNVLALVSRISLEHSGSARSCKA